MKGKRNRSLWVCVLVLAMLVSMCGTACTDVFVQAAQGGKVKSISVVSPEISALTMKKGSSYSLKTKLLPKTAKNKKVKYRSSKPSVASVSSRGVISAKKKGSARITVTAADGSGKKANVKVTVVKKLKKITKVTLNVRKVTLYTDGTAEQKTCTLKAQTSPKNATKKGVVFSSSDKSVAAVSKQGVVTAKKTGEATITANAADGWGKKATCKVVVKKSPSSENLSSENPATGNPTIQPTAADPTASPKADGTFVLASENRSSQIFLDETGEDYEGLALVANCLAEDVKMVADADMDIVTNKEDLTGTPVIAGSIGNNAVIDSLIAEGKLDVTPIQGKWETYRIAVLENPMEGIKQALVIAGSDKRGTIYGMFHLSELMGVSPWVYWADVNPKKQETVSFSYSQVETVSKEPSVKYRGIFLNDEEPALGTWVNNFFKEAKGGKFNEKFYEKVFQLVLRLKGNYMWPAMWNSAFGADGSASADASAKLADKYGIVMGTSHHEPMMRAHQEWVRNKKNYGNGEWDFVSNRDGLIRFFEDGAANNGGYDNIATIGMRGDGDAAMLPEGSTLEENISLLKEIITEQKNILKQHGLENKPKVLALYKEVEQYWQGGDGVPGLKEWEGLDDVIILLSEDNYGNVRTLPTDENRNREGGWGMYYHFDYNGAPASYQWVQTMQLQKVWEQMSMAYDYGIKDIWIVNVGDLKPMEMPISFFMDMAWDFERWGTDNINSAEEYQTSWIAEQFGNDTDEKGIEDITSIVSKYLKLNGSKKPEIVTSTTYSLTNYNEAMEVLKNIEDIMQEAEKYKQILPEEAQAAYYQLVYYPAVASANIHRMQIYSGLNKEYVKQKCASANVYAGLLEDAIALDKELEQTYNKNMPGGVGDKWDGMMAQARDAAHVGYGTWRPQGAYPKPEYLELPSESSMLVGVQGNSQVYKSGNVSLQEFTSINQETYTIDIANGGTTPFAYTLTSDQDWIRLSKTSGEVAAQDTVEVHVDFSKLTESSSGTISIEGNEQKVTVGVTASVMDTSWLAAGTFVEAHDHISIEAEHYTDSGSGKNGAQWKIIPGYGRGLSSLKVFPTTEKFSDVSEAPYVEYKVMTAYETSYSMETYFAPSNPVDADHISMKFGVSVDGGEVQIVDTINSSYNAGAWSDSTWSNGVRNNVHTASVPLGNLTWGEHTIRIYAQDPALVLQKMVLYSSRRLPVSCLGAPESYYVGK